MKVLILLALILICKNVSGQIVNDFDSLTYYDRMNGAIDSIDVSSADLPTTFDGGRSVLSHEGLSSYRLFNNITSLNFQPSIGWSKMEFSALPHLGFSYSFGGQTSQFLKAKYNHAFNDKNVLEMLYNRNSGIGSIRNANFSSNDLKLQYQRKGLKYTLQLKGSYTSYNVSHSGGVVVDTLIEDFGLEYTPVFKTNANSTNRVGYVGATNYFNFLKDSTRSLGLKTEHEFDITNRVYLENDYLSSIYPSIYIDSSSTRDQYNIAKLTNGVGVYFNSSSFYLDGAIHHAYWDYQNLGLHTDTNEVSLRSNLRLDIVGISLKNKLEFNLIGAFNEFSENINLSYTSGKIGVNGFAIVEQRSPDLIQRKYSGNYNNYKLLKNNLQSWFRAGGSVNYSFTSPEIQIGAFADYTSISDVYLFNGVDWAMNDTSSFSFATVGVSSKMKFGVFHFNPRVVFALDEKNYLPSTQFYGRFFVKGKLFKAKKLSALIGCDVSHISSFKTKTYIPSMDTYAWGGASSMYAAPMNLHAFVNFGIDEFRFFIRYENIGYFWTDKKIKEVNNYPIAGTRMRIGITWDFFN